MGSENFAIDEETGIITTLVTLDYEAVQGFSDLLVIIFDEDNLNSNVSLQIAVVDVNDNSPIYLPNSMTIMIRESTPLLSEIFTAMAIDADSTFNSLLTYSFGSPSSPDFTINAVSGAVSVQRPLDYETTRSYLLEIVATDGGMPSRNSTFVLTIDILDDNDNAPVVTNPGPLILVENSLLGSTIGTVTATDADSGTNAEVIYEIVAGNEAQNFAINRATGIIFTTGAIDREEISSYSLTVEVKTVIAFNLTCYDYYTNNDSNNNCSTIKSERCLMIYINRMTSE